jgi:hypothetical protein
MPKTAEEKRAYDRARYQANKERVKERSRQYREANRERCREYQRAHYQANKEQYAEKSREYNAANKEKNVARAREWALANPERKKRHATIRNWRSRGVIHDDFDALYEQYLAATHCEDCGVVFGKCGDGTGTFKCLDHCHETGAFRGIVCTGCNSRRT